MKVLIMSDSHGLTHEISMIIDRHKQEVAAMIHCGDSELERNDPHMADFLAVRGNCDYDSAYPTDIVEYIAGKRFFITHGHLYNIKMTLMNLSYKSEEAEADIICFGHSHAAGSESIDGKLFINPGSIRQPRGRKEKTYAILEMGTGKLEITYYDLEGKIVEELRNAYQME
ncbi:metallophosphoesterase [Peribacillus sp. NJ4]|uniref:metallophosphoesterase n=1 Tax=Peribacillus sp. NJ4 TaxID=3055862 RepID=UPI0025A1135E|nr:metallophosphoesterase [Peribacillus sp. NJ4]MDM5211428.1 metallophosphoesterase [Peribacillus sp. NJ4]